MIRVSTKPGAIHLGTLQDLVHVVGGAPVQVRQVHPQGEQAPGLHKLLEVHHRW